MRYACGYVPMSLHRNIVNSTKRALRSNITNFSLKLVIFVIFDHSALLVIPYLCALAGSQTGSLQSSDLFSASCHGCHGHLILSSFWNCTIILH